MPTDIWERCNAIEECYEFMLSYAAQGLPSDDSSPQVREFLQRATKALCGLASCFATTVQKAGLEPIERYLAFLDVLHRDAEDSTAAMELVLAQPAISSQLVDNLNASIHLRALLTDLFLFTEILRGQPTLVPATTCEKRHGAFKDEKKITGSRHWRFDSGGRPFVLASG
jgi:hypothetical protein